MLPPARTDMDCEQLKQRTKQFALRIIRLIRALPSSLESRIVANQLLRSSTSPLISYPRLVFRWRKQTNPFSGWNSSSMPKLSDQSV